jgi:hypothetical protein
VDKDYENDDKNHSSYDKNVDKDYENDDKNHSSYDKNDKCHEWLEDDKDKNKNIDNGSNF